MGQNANELNLLKEKKSKIKTKINDLKGKKDLSDKQLAKVQKWKSKLKKYKESIKQLKTEGTKKSENSNTEETVEQPKLDRWGLPTTTFDGHPLQSLEPLSEKALKKLTNVSLLLFYAYVEPSWNSKQYNEALEWAKENGEKYEMKGRLRIATEGFNGTITGPSNKMREFCIAMRLWKPEIFGQTDFKITDDLPEGQAFPEFKIIPVKEIVNYGLGTKQPSLKNGGIHLNAEDYHKKMEEPNTVIIDVRNTYEAVIGRFDPPPGGAQYIDPKMRVSTEFPQWVDKMKPELQGKQIMMFCTGGIRCERASALLREKGLDNIYQMQGGIHRYLEKYKDDGGHWVGKNYTFDKRFAHGAENAEVISRCLSCDKPWEKYRGNKRCPACRVPLLICESCQEEQKDSVTVCHLCKEENRKPEPSNREKRRQEQANNPQNVCAVCSESFKSRNAMFKHVEEYGHRERKHRKINK
ncbi:Rhodanese-like domain-containing protein [Globomyces pollinis-pini]|nr:Rhodanese-like domain-containing protein [Globomyces pollinis-pini]